MRGVRYDARKIFSVKIESIFYVNSLPCQCIVKYDFFKMVLFYRELFATKK